MIAGNFENKYNSKKPIERMLVGNFLSTFRNLLDRSKAPKKILEVGIGEGYLAEIVRDKFPKSQIWGCDVSSKILKIAERKLKGKNVHIQIGDAVNLPYKDNYFDLLICCEVLEHVNDAKRALSEIERVSKGKILMSVPAEPLWRLLNMSRGKYIRHFGNTPGHVNHWPPHKFMQLLEDSGMKILSVNYPLPWLMVLAKK